MLFTSRFDSAVAYASAIHAAQLRKGTPIPYLTHLLSVAALVGEAGGDEDQMIGGLLHDAAEDQGGLPRLADVRRRFGDRVAAIVEGCSDSLQESGAPKAPWRQRKETYIAHLAHATDDVALVSCADKLHNARSVLMDVRAEGEATLSRFSSGTDGLLWYLGAIAQTLRQRSQFAQGRPQRLLDELSHTVNELAETLGKSSGGGQISAVGPG